MKSQFYKLDGHSPVVCDNSVEWGRWFASANRRVANSFVGGVRVSTVFLGVDHSYTMHHEGGPVLFETMIFGGALDETQMWYETWDDAEIGHAAAVAGVLKSQERKEP